MSVFNSVRNSVGAPVKSTGQSKVMFLLLLSMGLSSFGIFLTFVNVLYTRSITNKEFPTLVQTTSGGTIEIGFEDPLYRSPETIKSYVDNTLYHLMTMTSFAPGDDRVSLLDPNRDKAPSMKVEGGGEITQGAWLASESLAGTFAETFKIQLADMTPPTVFNGTEEVILKMNYIEEPVEIESGKWEVTVIADLKVFTLGKRPGDITVETLPFNKVVTVRATSTPYLHDVEKFGELAVALNRVQQAGLQIIDIKDMSFVR